MCGITGILHFDKYRRVNSVLLKKMTDIISHRGPDGDGFFLKDNIGLGHRRLSIIDLETGEQPMHSDDKQVVIAFNGEIYNYLELKEELISLGHRFVTISDTEVIIKAYEEWGHECQNHFNGMWAFALWDDRKQELFLSRDRIGEKPLHYSFYDHSIIFGSEMKSLFEYGVPQKPDLSLLEIYLVLTNIPEPYSFYKDIKKLQAGHYLIVKKDTSKLIKYWDLPDLDEANMIKNKNAIYRKFEELFYDAIKLRMRADVPYGAFLSGGLDSSSVVSIMSYLSNTPVNTFTIGFDVKAYDESELALDVANQFNTIHHRGTVNPMDFDEIIRLVAFHYDEPFGDSSAIPTGYVSKFAAEKVKMVLTGDGGDELLSGYNSYLGLKIIKLINSLPSSLLNTYLQLSNIISPKISGNLKYKSNRLDCMIATARMPFVQRTINKISYTEYNNIEKLISSVNGIIPVKDYFYSILKNCSYRDDFYKMMYIHYKHSLPNDYLVKVDRMSMAY